MAVELAPPQIKILVTGDDLLALGDIGPCELVDGRVIEMSPTGYDHGKYEVRFAKRLDAFVSERKLGEVVSGEVGIYTHRNPDTVRAADVAYISNERYARQKKAAGFLEVAPELIVEILSPDDRWSEVTTKLHESFSIGVRLVWITDPNAKIVYAYRSLTDMREFQESDTLTGDAVLPGFSLPVASLFEE